MDIYSRLNPKLIMVNRLIVQVRNLTCIQSMIELGPILLG